MKETTVSATVTGQTAQAGLMSLRRWCRDAGVSEVSAWRWRKRGWIRSINIAGRQYIALEEIDRFTKRAAAGEFAKDHAVPQPPARREAAQ
jgi:hypothetical protein